MKLKYLFIFLIHFIPLCILGQEYKGKVIDVNTKEGVSFAQIFLPDLQVGTTTDENGNFEFTQKLPNRLQISIHCIGYETYLDKINTNTYTSWVIPLNPSEIELEEILVSSHSGSYQKNAIASIEKRSIKELNQIQQTNLGEALNMIPGVYNSSTGNGISKPIIRGLSGIRVVTYLNQLRIENQQWGGDHGQGISSMGIQNIEILKGPSSLLYGADAIGGVAYISDEPYANTNTSEINYTSNLETNSKKLSNTFGYKISKDHFRMNLYANNTTAADYQIEKNKFAKNSRFQTNDFKGSFGFHTENWVMNIRYNFQYLRLGIPGHTHDQNITPESFIYSTQSRNEIRPVQHIQNHYLLMNNKFFFKRSRLDISIGRTSNRLQEYEKLTVAGIDVTLNNIPYTAKHHYDLSSTISITSGVQGMVQTNKNHAKAEEILLPNAIQNDHAAFSIVKWQKNHWKIEAGGRYDYRILNVNSYKNNYGNTNFSIGLLKEMKHLIVRGNLSSGYRAPHLTELLSNGVHHATLRYEVGNSNLSPEFAQQIDFSANVKTKHINFIINPFYNQIKNYIYIKNENTTNGGYPVFSYTQTSRAKLYGTDIGIHIHPHKIHELHFSSTYSQVIAMDENNVSFPLIPQSRIQSMISYEFDMNTKVQIQNIALQHHFYFEQNNIAPNETTSLEYQVVNFGLNLIIPSEKLPIKIKTGITNIFDKKYIPHVSRLKNIGIPYPGRNYYITLTFNINQKLKNHEKSSNS